MRWITLFFISMQFFYLFNTRELYYLMDLYTKLAKDKQSHPGEKTVILINDSSLFFLLYMIADFLYLIYGIYLLVSDNYWQQGGMLLIISALEAYAHHMKVAYTYVEDPAGFCYPNSWCKCLFTAASLFILTRIYASL